MNNNPQKPTVATLCAEYANTYGSNPEHSQIETFEITFYKLITKNNFKDLVNQGLWNSILVVDFCHILIDSPASSPKEDALLHYFSYDNNVSDDFVQTLAHKYPNEFIRFAKLSKAFLKERHWQSFSFLLTSQNKELRELYKQFDFIASYLAKWETKEAYYNGLLVNFSYTELLVHVVSYFEKFKRASKSVTNASNYKTMIEVNLAYITDKMLTYKLANSGSPTQEEQNLTKLKAFISQELPPINPIEGIIQGTYLPTETISNTKKCIREMIDFFYSKHSFDTSIDLYCTGMSDFKNVYGKNCLVGNQKKHEHSMNDKKHPFVEMVLMNLALKSPKVQAFNQTTNCFLTKQINFSVEKCLLYFDFYKLPTIYYLNKDKDNKDKTKKIDFEKVFKLLCTFSNYLMPSGRNIIMNPPAYDASVDDYRIDWLEWTVEKPQTFTDIFVDDENYLSVFTEDDVVAKIVKYFSWDTIEVKNILEFLTLDLFALQGKQFDVTVFEKPFIKVGKVYYWLSSFMKDRRWEVVMHSAILEAESLQTDFINARGKERLVEYDKVQIPDLEANLAKEFENKGFKAVSGFKLYDENGGTLTDIDVVAYKDNFLYIIQAKCTKPSEQPLVIERWHTRKVEGEAFEQTCVSEAWLWSEYFGDVQAKNLERLKKELEINCPHEDLRIVPIILTNTFPYDGVLQKSIEKNTDSPILKMSIFELIVILRNSLKDMLFLDKSFFSSFLGNKDMQNSDFSESDMPFLSFLQVLNANSDVFKQDYKGAMEKFNFYKDEQNPQNEEIAEIFKDDKVWSFIPIAFNPTPIIYVLEDKIEVRSIMDGGYIQI